MTLHPLQSTTPDFWRLVYDYGCTSIVMLNQLNQSNSAWVRLARASSAHPQAQPPAWGAGSQLRSWGLGFLIYKQGFRWSQFAPF